MLKRGKKNTKNNPIKFIIIGLLSLALLLFTLLHGNDIALLNPKGLIARQQFNLMLFTVIVLLEVAIPTVLLLFFIAWKYRESNEKVASKYEKHTHHGKLLVIGMWGIPIITMLILASTMWPAAHRLAPQKSIAVEAKPLTIQVVAMRWKWLFIYPEQRIATVNFVQIPVDTPVEFNLTADETPMSSFWIPHLGGQLYAMTGHANLLHLMAETTGDFTGSAAEINGDGFAGMRFVARSSSNEDFNKWVEQAKQSSVVLDGVEYKKLQTPSENNQATLYSEVQPGLYDTILLKYAGSHDHNPEVE